MWLGVEFLRRRVGCNGGLGWDCFSSVCWCVGLVFLNGIFRCIPMRALWGCVVIVLCFVLMIIVSVVRLRNWQVCCFVCCVWCFWLTLAVYFGLGLCAVVFTACYVDASGKRWALCFKVVYASFEWCGRM